MNVLTFDLFEKKKDGPCWKGYKQVGMKTKGGKKVPNCVPDPENKIEAPKPTKKNEAIKRFGEMNESTDGSYMTVSNVQTILRAAQYLSEKIKEDTALEGWVIDKLAKASGDLWDVHEFYMNLGKTEKAKTKWNI